MTPQAFKARFSYDEKKDFLGAGGFSKVYRADDSVRKEEVALKIYQSSFPAKYGFEEEFKRAQSYHHPNLLRYFEAFTVQGSDSLGNDHVHQIAVLEYAPFGEFYDFIKTFPEENEIQAVVEGILSGMAYLQGRNVIHRDLKPHNILMCKDGQGIWLPKIADFGLSKHLDDNSDMSSQLLGTVEFMAPEQFNPRKFGVSGQIQPNVDIWSLGVMIYKVYTGRFPFGAKAEGHNRDQIMRAILAKEPDEEALLEVPQPMQTVIRRCLIKDAGKRAVHSKELLDILQNPQSALPDALPTEMDLPRVDASQSVQTAFEGRNTRQSRDAASKAPPAQKPPQRKSPKEAKKQVKKQIKENPKRKKAPFIARFFLFLVPWAVLILPAAAFAGEPLGLVGFGILILAQGLMLLLIRSGADPEGKIRRILRPLAWGTLSIILVFALVYLLSLAGIF